MTLLKRVDLGRSRSPYENSHEGAIGEDYA